MHVLLATTGSAGDVFPFVAMGCWLRGRGHAVTVLAPEAFAALVQRHGLPFDALKPEKARSVAPSLLGKLAHPLTRRWRKLGRCSTLLPLVRPTYESIERLHIPHRTVVVSLWPLLGARLAHERLGIPLATVVLSPAYLRSVHRPPLRPPFVLPAWLPHWAKRLAYRGLDRIVLDPLLAGDINQFRGELKLPSIRRVLDRWCHSPQMILGLYPEWFSPPQPDAPDALRLTGFLSHESEAAAVMPIEAERFLDAGPPPIVCLAGSAIRGENRYFAESIKACLRLGRRALLLTRHPAQLPAELPAGVRAFDYLPLDQLLPRSAALIHCGGVGTAARALAAAIPQLVMPLKNDQHENARCLVELGVARTLRFDKCAESAVAHTLSALLLSSTVAERCRAVAKRTHEDLSLDRVCRLIESLAAPSATLPLPIAA